MSFRINGGYVPPAQKTGSKNEIVKSHSRQGLFQNILDQEIQKKDESIKISGHASRRLMERNITLNDKDMQALSRAMTKADAKGARDSLMLYKDIAFIASVKNRILITAIDPQDSEENVFTNIDSAVIVK